MFQIFFQAFFRMMGIGPGPAVNLQYFWGGIVIGWRVVGRLSKEDTISPM